MTERRKRNKVEKAIRVLVSNEVEKIWWEKILTRCLLEGCRASRFPNEKPATDCVYCGRHIFPTAPYGIGLIESLTKKPQ